MTESDRVYAEAVRRITGLLKNGPHLVVGRNPPTSADGSVFVAKGRLSLTGGFEGDLLHIETGRYVGKIEYPGPVVTLNDEVLP